MIIVACVGAGVGAAFAPGRPTGLLGVDFVYRVAFAVLVTLACTYARRWSWLVLAGVATVFAAGVWVAPPAIALTLAALSAFERRRRRRVGAVIGALSVQALLRLPPWWFHGATAIVVGIAAGLVFASAYRNAPPVVQRRCRLAATCLGGIGIVFTLLVVIGGLIAGTRMGTGISQSQRAADAAASGDAAGARAAIGRADSALVTAHSFIGSWFTAPARLVPIAAQHRKALSTATGLSHEVTAQIEQALTKTRYDRLALTHGHLDVQALAGTQQQLNATATTANAAAAALNPVHDQWVLGPFKTRLARLDRSVAGLVPDIEQAAAAARAVPPLLGADGPRHYFIALVDPAESRGLGGTIDAYAEVVANNGSVSVVRSGPITDLENAAPPGTRQLAGLQDFQVRYGGFAPTDHLRDLTYSPDAPTVAEAIRQLYPQSGGGPLDGVVIVDPTGMGALLGASGPVHVNGIPGELTAASAPRLLTGADDPTMATALRAVLDQLTTKAVVEPRVASRWFAPPTHGRHLQMVSFHPAEDRYLRQVGADRPYPRAGRGDVLGITTQNAGTNTLDVSLHRSLTAAAYANLRSGNVYMLFSVTLRNDSSQPNLTWFTLYTGLQLFGPQLNHQNLTMQVGHEFGLNTYSSLVNLPPHSSAVLLGVAAGVVSNPYHVTLASQPNVNPDQASMAVHVGADDRLTVTGATAGHGKQLGTMTWQGPLTRDHIISVTLAGAGGGHGTGRRAD